MKKEESAAFMTDILRRIGGMNDAELSQVVLSVMGRYQKLFPQEEIIFLSLPKDDPDERQRILEAVSCLVKLEYIE